MWLTGWGSTLTFRRTENPLSSMPEGSDPFQAWKAEQASDGSITTAYSRSVSRFAQDRARGRDRKIPAKLLAKAGLAGQKWMNHAVCPQYLPSPVFQRTWPTSVNWKFRKSKAWRSGPLSFVITLVSEKTVMNHAFLSYVHDDRALVYRLCSDLEKSGVIPWLDRNRIQPDQPWQSSLRRAIVDGAFFLACFSDEYAESDSGDTSDELMFAIEQLQKDDANKKWFIPIRLADCRIPERMISVLTLLDIQWVDLFDDWHKGIREILAIIDPEIQKQEITIAKLQQSRELTLIAINNCDECVFRCKVDRSFVIPKYELENIGVYVGSEYIQIPTFGTTIRIDICGTGWPIIFTIDLYDTFLFSSRHVPTKLLDCISAAVGVEGFEVCSNLWPVSKTSTWGYLEESDGSNLCSVYFLWAPPKEATTIDDVLSQAAAIEKGLESYLSYLRIEGRLTGKVNRHRP